MKLIASQDAGCDFATCCLMQADDNASLLLQTLRQEV